MKLYYFSTSHFREGFIGFILLLTIKLYSKFRKRTIPNLNKFSTILILLTDFYSYDQERVGRQANLANDTKSATVTADTVSKINKLLTETGVQLCQSKGDSC